MLRNFLKSFSTFSTVKTTQRGFQCSIRRLQNDTEQESSISQEVCEFPSVIPTMLQRNVREPVSIAGYDSGPVEAWLETLKCPEDRKLGMLDLNPDVFGVFPRLDIIHENLRWQGTYRFVDWRKITTRWEIKRTGKKLYPQKGTGRARHGDRTAPLFIGGAQVTGPRGPISFFRRLEPGLKLAGLTSALTIKFTQDDLHIVDELTLPSNTRDYLEGVIQSRGWGNSVLFVNDSDEAPRNLATVCSQVPHYCLMPVSSLNVWSLLKYDTVVLSLTALDQLEARLVAAMIDPANHTAVQCNTDEHPHRWQAPRQTSNFYGNPESHEDWLKFE